MFILHSEPRMAGAITSKYYMSDIRKKTFLSFSVDSIIEAAENNYTLQQEIYSQSEDWREQNEIAYWNDYAM